MKDITDNVIRPKIDATVHAHENLWGIYFLAAPTLREDQVARLKEIAEFWYTTLPKEKRARLTGVYEKLAEEYTILRLGESRDFSAVELRKGYMHIAGEVMRVASELQSPEKSSLKATLEKAFKVAFARGV